MYPQHQQQRPMVVQASAATGAAVPVALGPGGAAQAAATLRAQTSMKDLTGCPVTIYLSYKGIKSRDAFSASDPFAQLQVLDTRSGRWCQLGTTETIKNQASGQWAKTFETRFVFEEKQQMCVKVFDFDKHSEHDFCGQVGFTLGNVMGSAGQTMMLKLGKPGKADKDRGYVIIHAEKQGGTGGRVNVQLCAKKLDAKDFGHGFLGMGKSDPYFRMERVINNNPIIVYKSEFIKNESNPYWSPAQVSLDKLCQGNLDQNFQISVYDYDDGTKDDLIGHCSISVNGLKDAFLNQKQIPVIHPPTKRKYQKKSYKNSGLLQVLSCETIPSPTDEMLNFISGGLHINLLVAVDFTASNGNPTDPRSLHYHSNSSFNQYQSALQAVGTILSAYDSDGSIPAFGFGGSFGGQTSHCFPLNGNPSNPNVQGVPGLLQAYDQALLNVPLSGPTYFGPLLSQVEKLVFNPEMSQQAQEYNVLILLTDGVVMDMQATVDKIVALSNMPLSIVIVGVGNADFSDMDTLDADDVPLRASNGTKTTRDIVQFVPFSKFKNNAALLAKETLHEIPSQLVQYFRSKKIRPNPPLRAPSQLIAVGSDPDISIPVAAAAAPPSAPGTQASLASSGRALLSKAYQF